jgi:hypothetical protein
MMKFVSGKTKNEKALVTGLQVLAGAKPDNSIGPDTLVCLAQKIPGGEVLFPTDLTIFGCPTHISQDIIAFDPDSGLIKYDDSISGSFTYRAGETPCSILVNNGVDLWSSASKAWAGFKESVLCKWRNGRVAVEHVKTTSEISDRKNLIVAVGGMGLLSDYDPNGEGFRKFIYNGVTYNHADVLRKTDHVVLGWKNGYFYGVFFRNMTAQQINEKCKNDFKFQFAILLDGGHIAGFNGTDNDINLYQKQGYIIQFVKR